MKYFHHLFLLAFLLFAALCQAQTDSLRTFIDTWQGIWIQSDHPLDDPLSPEPKWVVQIDPDYISGDEVAILLSEYYQDGIVDVLWFEYANGGLEYKRGNRDGLELDISKIDYVRLMVGKEGGKAGIVLELLEAENENFVYAPLLHMPPESHPGWAWGLQQYFRAFLEGGSYDILGQTGIPTTLDAALGQENVLENLAFVNEHTVLFPMFEEIGLQANMDLVMLGSPEPGGELDLYAIEWTPMGIFLYETEMRPHASDPGIYVFLKGELSCAIIPRLPIEPTRITQ